MSNEETYDHKNNNAKNIADFILEIDLSILNKKCFHFLIEAPFIWIKLSRHSIISLPCFRTSYRNYLPGGFYDIQPEWNIVNIPNSTIGMIYNFNSSKF